MTQEAPAMIKSVLPGRRMNLEEWNKKQGNIAEH